jgi:uncharacterized protein YbgA (DUF1722 family)
VFAYAHWQAYFGSDYRSSGLLSASRLITFHSRYKYLLMAHSVPHYQRAGRVLSDLKHDLADKAGQYRGILMAGLAVPATANGHANVLSHLQGYFKTHPDTYDRQELHELIRGYQRGEQPLMASSDAPSTLPASSVPLAEPTDARWSRELKDVVRDTAELSRMLAIDPADLAVDANASFPLRVPRAFRARMRQGDPADPLLRQVLPRNIERAVDAGFTADPLREHAAMVTPALMQKYAGRMLLMTASDRAVHCRYCFRRNFPYAEHRLSVDDESLRAIAGDDSKPRDGAAGAAFAAISTQRAQSGGAAARHK